MLDLFLNSYKTSIIRIEKHKAPIILPKLPIFRIFLTKKLAGIPVIKSVMFKRFFCMIDMNTCSG